MIQSRLVVAFALFASAGLALPAAGQLCDPSPPRNVRASDRSECGTVWITWDEPANGIVVLYRVFRGPSQSQATDPIGTSVNRNFRDLLPGQNRHFYRVKAIGACGTSDYSNANAGEAAWRPHPPQGVTATDGTRCGEVRITWDNAPDANAWEVFLETPLNPLSLGSTSEPAFIHPNPLPGTVHRYRIVANSGICGQSDPSGWESGFAGRAPRTPDVTASSDQCGGVRVSWQADPFAKRPVTYKIWRNTSNFFGSADQVDQFDGYYEEYFDTSAAGGVRYFYWVEVKNDCALLWTRNVGGAEGERYPWPHSFSRHPENVIATRGTRAEFSVEVTGQTPLAYRWLRNGQTLANGNNIQGADTAHLTIDPVDFGDAGTYEVRIYNTSCPQNFRTSDPATLEVTRVECYADCTRDSFLDIFDFLCFANYFGANDPYACDCETGTGPGVCDIFDFLCFQNAYDAGCP